MDLQIHLLLIQDGITNGAIYALLSLALVLVFAVTRVIFIPQGEFVAYGALTLAVIQAGKVPPTVWFLVAMGAAAAAIDAWQAVRESRAHRVPSILGVNLGLPLALAGILHAAPIGSLPLVVQILLTLAVVVPLGPMIYRLAYQPVAEATVLLLLIVSVAVHMALLGLGLFFFGAEGTRTPPFTEGSLTVGSVTLQYQTLWIVGITVLLIVGLFAFFERTLYGKALRATAINRTGAKLMGISTDLAGKLSFALAALVGAFSGVLVSPITTVYYDTGFLMGLKGFVGAIIGGLASYPVASLGALLVGLLESYSSFWASAYKEVIVFTLIIPVLLWRSLTTHHVEEEEH
ncbi:MAG: branched-chain amino acid ABC transporter permease [Rhodocyclaceae bacterium]|nr:branched-chain amino acid ABC transporter permease [Rhodocyclaceae bacterium]